MFIVILAVGVAVRQELERHTKRDSSWGVWSWTVRFGLKLRRNGAAWSYGASLDASTFRDSEESDKAYRLQGGREYRLLAGCRVGDWVQCWARKEVENAHDKRVLLCRDQRGLGEELGTMRDERRRHCKRGKFGLHIGQCVLKVGARGAGVLIAQPYNLKE